MQKTANILLSIFCLFLLIDKGYSIDKCDDPSATLHDGFLDTFVYYGSFNRDQNSYFRFRNPFFRIDKLAEGSVMFWARLPRLTADATAQRGRLFECTDMFLARLDNNTIRFNVTQNATNANGTVLNTLTRFPLNVTQFSNSLQPLLQWNHFAFAIKDKFSRIFFNGLGIGETQLNQSFVNTASDLCTIGNSKDLNDPLNAHIRHLSFSLQGLSETQDIRGKIRSMILPTDTQILAYFSFSREFNLMETYFYNASRTFTSSNVQILYSSEPESVCYCTAQSKPFVRLSNNFRIKPINLTALNHTIDANGIILQFWMYPVKLDADTDNMLFAIQNYTNIVLSGQGNTLKVELFNQSARINGTVSFTKYRFTYQHWSLFTIQITNTQAILFVNGNELDRRVHNVSLPTNVIVKNLTIGVGAQLQALLYKFEMYKQLTADEYMIQTQLADMYANPNADTQLTVGATQFLFGIKFTLDQLMNQVYASSGNTVQTHNGYFKLTNSDKVTVNASNTLGFVFEQNNRLCINKDYMWDGLSCKSDRNVLDMQATQFSRQSYLTGKLPSVSNQIALEFWFKVKEEYLVSDPNRSVIFSLYENNATSIFQIYVNKKQDTTFRIVCDPTINNVINDNRSTNINNTDVVQPYIWIHYACVSDKGAGNATRALAYNLNAQTEARAQRNGTGITVSNSANPQITYIGNNLQSNSGFTGSLKDIRIFRQPITDQQIRNMRFIKGQVSWIPSSAVLSFIHLTNNYQSFIFDSYTGVQTSLAASRSLSQVQTVNSSQIFQWTQDKDFVQCPMELYHDGQCCTKPNLFPEITFQEHSNGTVTAFVTLGIERIDKMATFTWIVSKVSPTNAGYQAALNQTVAPQRFGQFISINVSQIFLNSSFTLQVIANVPYSQKPVSVAKDVILDCPRASIVNTTQHIVTQWGYEEKIVLLGRAVASCFQFTPGTLLVKSVTWTHNNTLADGSKLNDSSPWTVSTTGYQVTFNKEQAISNDTTIEATFTVIFSNNFTYTEKRTVTFLQQGIQAFIEPIYYLPLGTPNFVIDGNSTKILMTNLNRNQVRFWISCQPGLLRNNTRDCVFNQTTGVFAVNVANMTEIFSYIDYNFNISIGKVNSVATFNRTVKLRYYQAGVLGTNCPGVNVGTQLDVPKSQLKQLNYTTPFQLDCGTSGGGMIRYNMQNLKYSINADKFDYYATQYNQTLPSRLFNETFNTTNNNRKFSFRNDTIINRLNSGNLIPITVSFDAIEVLTNQTTQVSQDFDLAIGMSQIVLVSNVSATTVPFEDDLIVNASASYDPDYLNQTLTFEYKCNDQPCNLDASQMNRGILRIGLMDRLRLGYQYDTDYTFAVSVSNSVAQRKQTQVANYTVQFMKPANGTHRCPRPYFFRGNNTANRVTNLIFNTYNATDLDIKINQEPCDTLTSYIPTTFLLSLNKTNITSDDAVTYQTNNTSNFTLSFKQTDLIKEFQMTEQTTVRMIFVFNYTASNVRRLGYSVTDFNLTRLPAPLVPIITPNNTQPIEFGIEENYVISLSQSFDPEQIPLAENQSYSFQFQCSAQSLCQGLSSSDTQVTITKRMRKQAQLTKVGNTFWIAVTMRVGNRSSQTANQTYRLIAQDYTRCVTVNDLNKYIQIDDLDEQIMPIIFKPQQNLVCDDAKLWKEAVWKSSTETLQFWQSNAKDNYSVLVSPANLRRLPKDKNINLNVQFQYAIQGESQNTAYLSQKLDYTIVIKSQGSYVNLEIPAQIDLNSSQPQIIQAKIVNAAVDQSKVTCSFTCYFGSIVIDDCGTEKDKCSFNVLDVTVNHPDIEYTTEFSTIAVSAIIDANAYYSKKPISFIRESDRPRCNITQVNNMQLENDKPTVFQVNCSNYRHNQLQYLWNIQGLNSDNDFTNKNDKQTVKVNAGSFAKIGSPEKIITCEVIAKDNQMKSLSSLVISRNRIANISAGQVFVQPDEIYARTNLTNITFSGFQDSTSGPLFYQIKMHDPVIDNFYHILISKTQQKSFMTTLLPMNELHLEVYDQKGNFISATKDINLLDTPRNISNISFADFYNQTIIQFWNQTVQDPGNTNPSHIEITLNNIIIAADLIQSNYTNLTQNETVVYLNDLFTKLNDTFKFARDTYGTQEVYHNCYNKALLALIHLYDSSLISRVNTMISQYYDEDYFNQPNQVQSYATTMYFLRLQEIIKSRTPNITQQQISIINDRSNRGMKKYKQQMVNGESVKFNKLISKKISLIDSSDNGVEVQNEKVKFNFPKESLSKLNLSDAFLVVEIENITLFTQTKNDSMTLVSQIVEVNLTDNNDTVQKITNSSASLLFSDIDARQYANLKCAYFDPVKKDWLFESDGGLTTEVDRVNSVVKCTTTHLSTYTVMNITIDGFLPINDDTDDDTPVPVPDQKIEDKSNSESTRRIIVYVIMGILILLAIISFIVMACKEETWRDVFMRHQFSTLQKDIKFLYVWANFSKLWSIFYGVRLPWYTYFIIFLNYLLYASLFVLAHFAINNEGRILGDYIYLIIAIVLVYIFSAPMFKHLTIYRFFKFEAARNFDGIFQAELPSDRKPEQKGPKHSQQNDNVSLSSIPEDLQNHQENQTEAQIYLYNNEKNAFENKQFNASQVVKGKDRFDNNLKHSRARNVEMDLDLEQNQMPQRAMQIVSPRSMDRDIEHGESFNNSHHNVSLHPKNLKVLQSNNKNEKNLSSLNKNVQEVPNDSINSESSDHDHQLYEGGSPQKGMKVPDSSARNLRNNQANGPLPNRRAQYQAKEVNSNGIVLQQQAELEETVDYRVSDISMVQSVLLVIAAGVNGFLFWFVGIQKIEENLIPYIACLLIPIGFLLFIFDPIMSAIIASSVRNNGFNGIGKCGGAFVFGMFGTHRFRTL